MHITYIAQTYTFKRRQFQKGANKKFIKKVNMIFFLYLKVFPSKDFFKNWALVVCLSLLTHIVIYIIFLPLQTSLPYSLLAATFFTIISVKRYKLNIVPCAHLLEKVPGFRQVGAPLRSSMVSFGPLVFNSVLDISSQLIGHLASTVLSLVGQQTVIKWSTTMGWVQQSTNRAESSDC